ncbi:MAG: SUMF1/EgtB/PvdO family nonheme iron enzyme [Acidobacteria bacterium]|nr:SUMF1/EgtB/PvdO family nonheme iron enzyme [Acidobacteriota bacterium]
MNVAARGRRLSDFVRIPAGWFLMGSDDGQRDEAPAHRVWTDAFELAVDPVTRAQYARFLEATGRAAPREWDRPRFAAPDLPVVGVSWNDAVVYCLWRSSQLNDPARLPTEAEWERAVRAGREGEAYPGGGAIPAWIPQAGKGPLDGPWPVALGPPNAYGVRGIAANIHEWCADWHAAGYYAGSPRRNPRGPDTGVRRASRGGSWRHAVTISRSAARSKLDPSFRYTDYGFRVARDV